MQRAEVAHVFFTPEQLNQLKRILGDAIDAMIAAGLVPAALIPFAAMSIAVFAEEQAKQGRGTLDIESTGHRVAELASEMYNAATAHAEHN
jgi:hypothetical protein